MRLGTRPCRWSLRSGPPGGWAPPAPPSEPSRICASAPLLRKFPLTLPSPLRGEDQGEGHFHGFWAWPWPHDRLLREFRTESHKGPPYTAVHMPCSSYQGGGLSPAV